MQIADNYHLSKVLIVGLWHQGIVGAGCLAEMGYEVTATDLNKNIINGLKKSKSPIYEPNLEKLISNGIKSKKLIFTDDLMESVRDKKIIFLMNDTPVDENDQVDLTEIFKIVDIISPKLVNGSVICVTAQVPVGTCDKILRSIKKNRPDLIVGMAYIPENLRLGDAINRFYNPEMPVIGANEEWIFNTIKSLLNFKNVDWINTNIKTAEMSKHALNTFLATSITFANELGAICDNVGADGFELAKILRLESRVGSKAMLMPGLGFSGGTLARDTQVLINIGKQKKIKTPFLDGLWKANIMYNQVVLDFLLKDFKTLKNLKICVLGLTYKPNTSTLRRSISISTINDLFEKGAIINAYDPMVDSKEISKNTTLSFFQDPYKAIIGTDVIVIMTGWEEFKKLDFKLIKSLMRGNYILDTNNMLDYNVMINHNFTYKCIGRGNNQTK